MDTVNVISISGGKDSTALWLLAKERETENMKVIFSDVGHEHPETYKYIDYLQKELGEITIIKPDFSDRIIKKREVVQTKWRNEGISENIIDEALGVLKPTGIPFLDLCLWKGRFPSTMARFCTQELKVIPVYEQVYMPLFESGNHVVSWQGIRAQESRKRAMMPEREDTPEGYEVYRPLIKWDVYDVFKMHDKHGIKPNPLYTQGMGRVGCMPCINSRKDELFEIARRFPSEIERVAEWERIVGKASKRGSATFFTSDDRGHGINEVVEWSKTSRGGKNYDLEKFIAWEDAPTCSSQYGLCE
ncbi:3'-phosphoadenosine 5'-phosphosulfate sulfotransferase (PAPS reductase)/FAD synthetase [Cytobacillus horneckiae]|uniref:phosphoadenosine phosphosulfate reductase domain-containing protein n=1 Tax=Cytobacillus horneckiae TaxID=549687 RepID=UPI0019D1F2D4|nr:phosphoadenosine phosphosulfate reductase family protein [Cytobacillus horneckiae]MBN6889827.1 phosphoadenosine phosphosulfate reductase family protein [Cytobacillus horneckiae]